MLSGCLLRNECTNMKSKIETWTVPFKEVTHVHWLTIIGKLFCNKTAALQAAFPPVSSLTLFSGSANSVSNDAHVHESSKRCWISLRRLSRKWNPEAWQCVTTKIRQKIQQIHGCRVQKYTLKHPNNTVWPPMLKCRKQNKRAYRLNLFEVLDAPCVCVHAMSTHNFHLLIRHSKGANYSILTEVWGLQEQRVSCIRGEGKPSDSLWQRKL